MKLRAFLRSDIGISLVIVLAWKLILLSVGFLIDTSGDGARSLIDHTARWDAGWYLNILQHWYDTPASPAFYPLFPLLVQIIQVLSFGLVDPLVAGQVVNTVALFFGVWGLLALGRRLLGDQKRFWLIALALAAPAGFFFHVFYSESVFLALSVWAYLFALRKQWLPMAVLLAALTATRLPSVLVIALCGLEYLRAYGWNIKTALNRSVLAFLLVPVGFLSYSAYLWLSQGDGLAMFHAYHVTNDWVYQVFNPNIFETIARSGYQALRVLIGQREPDGEFVVNIALPLASLGLIIASSTYILMKYRQKLLPLAVSGYLAVIMFTLNSNLVSIHRYTITLLVASIGLALFFAARRHGYVYLIVAALVGVSIQFLLYSRFITGVFAG
jgi:hypothetical protein